VLSMTGFGSAARRSEGRGHVEVRALNHRFLEVSVRMPPNRDTTFFVEQLARERLDRGRYDIGARVRGWRVPTEAPRERARPLRRAHGARDEVAPARAPPATCCAARGGGVGPRSAEPVQKRSRRTWTGLSPWTKCDARGLLPARDLSSKPPPARRLRDEIARRAAECWMSTMRLRERVARLSPTRIGPHRHRKLETS
jgi:hypothetical protein